MKRTDFFEKNMQALKAEIYANLRKELLKIKESKKFETIVDYKDPLNLNIIELKTNKKIYKEPLKELETNLKNLESKSNHPVLFFYGIGNGFLYKVLLQNSNFKKIIVFEKDKELLFIALNLADFSQELASGRLILFLNKEIDYNKACSIFSLGELYLFYRSYFLNIHSKFYEEQRKDIAKLNALNKEVIVELSLRQGNDPKDALQGIEQFVYNLPKMITHPSLDELIKKRKNKAQNAIIVATGPSLTKQLPLLKKYANKASIFCLDASYAILAKKNIKPDYVLSLERVKASSEFFDNDFKEFDKDILFILLTLTHPQTLENLEKNKRTYMLSPRSLSVAQDLALKEFGFLNGMSVAHMAFSLALSLGHKNIILIGQDLAFAKDGSTHSKDYPRGEAKAKIEIGSLSTKMIKAYGGRGKVKTTRVWELFRNIYENLIYSSRNHCKTYNCTEGGARIEGAIEKPFKEVCKEFLNEELQKPFPKIKAYKREIQNQFLLKSYEKIQFYMNTSEKLAKEFKKISNQIKGITQTKKTKHSLEEICKNIDKIRVLIGHKKYFYLQELLGPSIFHSESSLAPLYLEKVENESGRQNKMVSWVFANEAWVDEVYNLILIENGIFKKAIIPLRELLEKRKLI